MSGSILTLNAGSSSLKFALFDQVDEELRSSVRGQVDGLGAVGEDQRRAAAFFDGLADSGGRLEATLCA